MAHEGISATCSHSREETGEAYTDAADSSSGSGSVQQQAAGEVRGTEQCATVIVPCIHPCCRCCVCRCMRGSRVESSGDAAGWQ